MHGCAFVILLPFLGSFVYFIAEGKGMAERKASAMADAQARMDSHIRLAAGTSGGSAAEIAKAKELLDSGVLTQAEFDALKQKALA